MKRLIPLILVSVFCLWTSLEAGQIYEWVDSNGVRHFTNEPPPPGAKIVNEQKAIQYDEAADQQRMQDDQEVLDQDMNQQEPQPEQQQQQSQQQSQPETPAAQTDDSGETVEGVVAEPYDRNREQLRRRYERRQNEREEIVTPLPSRSRRDERIR